MENETQNVNNLNKTSPTLEISLEKGDKNISFVTVFRLSRHALHKFSLINIHAREPQQGVKLPF
jgi:hypothetical protein